MRTQEVSIYTFDELSDDAKNTARDWWREGAMHDDWYDSIYCDAERVANILGIEFDQKQVPLMNGTSRTDPKIWFSGFYSQGDGACFEGDYSYSSGSCKRIREYAPQDSVLHGIADDLARVQKPHFYQLRASCQHSGHYYHSGCMRVSVERADDPWRDIGDDETAIRDALRAFADWIYSQLESEYEYQMSEESIDETICANGYEFTACGDIVF